MEASLAHIRPNTFQNQSLQWDLFLKASKKGVLFFFFSTIDGVNLGHILIEPKQEDGYYDIFLSEKDNKHVFHTILALYQMNYLISIAHLSMLKEYRRR